MHKTAFILLFITLCISALNAYSADIRTGNVIRIDTAVSEDLYAAAQKIIIKAPVRGDLIGAGQEIRIEDSIYGDINAACEILHISGPVMDDARIAVRAITLESEIMGDLVVFAAETHIAKNARIRGDLIVFSGEVTIDGTIDGAIILKGGKITINGSIQGSAKVSAGELIINGSINGPAELAANSIQLSNSSLLKGETRYWQEAGKLAEDKENDLLIFDESLAREIQEKDDWKALPMGFAVWNILFGILAITLFHFMFKKPTAKASYFFISDSIRSIGYGLLYFLLIPIVAVLFILSLIGIPFGILLFILYLASLFFSIILASLVITYSYQRKYNKHWNNWPTIGFSIIVYLVLKLIMLIPVIGFLIICIVVLATLGSYVMSFRRKKEIESVG